MRGAPGSLKPPTTWGCSPRGPPLRLFFPSSWPPPSPALCLHTRHHSTRRPGSDLPPLPQPPETPAPAWACPGNGSSPAGWAALPGPADSQGQEWRARGSLGQSGSAGTAPNRSLESRFLENFLELGLVASHTQCFQAPQGQVQSTYRASALDLPLRTQNSPLTSEPLHLPFPHPFPCLDLPVVTSSKKASLKLHPSPG